jgi:hypothetical protein
MLRILLSAGNILLSLIIGALMMGFCAIYWPDTLSIMMDAARALKELITSTGLAAKYNVWLRFLLEENQLLLMFFAVFARILLGILFYPIARLRDRAPPPYYG